MAMLLTRYVLNTLAFFNQQLATVAGSCTSRFNFNVNLFYKTGTHKKKTKVGPPISEQTVYNDCKHCCDTERNFTKMFVII